MEYFAVACQVESGPQSGEHIYGQFQSPGSQCGQSSDFRAVAVRHRCQVAAKSGREYLHCVASLQQRFGQYTGLGLSPTQVGRIVLDKETNTFSRQLLFHYKNEQDP